MRATARRLLVAITIFSWVAISNHCAVGAITTRPDSTHNECPFHSKPSKPKSSESQPCCKILRAITPTPAKNLAPAIVDLIHVDLAFGTLEVFAPPTIFFAPATFDTGPPGKTSFAELIGSLRAHAPPFLA